MSADLPLPRAGRTDVPAVTVAWGSRSVRLMPLLLVALCPSALKSSCHQPKQSVVDCSLTRIRNP